jgi:hypothetical protein
VRIGAVLTLLTLSAAVSSPAAPGSHPQNPCELLTVSQISSATGVEITRVSRKPDFSELMAAKQESRKPGAGQICIYETYSEFGDIFIALPREQDAAHFRQDRDVYFARSYDSAKPIPNLGQDAWLASGATLQLLVSDDFRVTFSTLLHRRGSEELLIRLAKTLLSLQKSFKYR